MLTLMLKRQAFVAALINSVKWNGAERAELYHKILLQQAVAAAELKSRAGLIRLSDTVLPKDFVAGGDHVSGEAFVVDEFVVGAGFYPDKRDDGTERKNIGLAFFARRAADAVKVGGHARIGNVE